MEIDKTRINKKNYFGESHGCWADGYIKRHYYNNLRMGYEQYDRNSTWKCHYINNKEIGCEEFNNSQRFYKTPGKRFGEQIKWK